MTAAADVSPELAAQVRPLIAAIAETERIQRLYPLATARLWHRESPRRTSQRRAFTEGIAEDIHWVQGGKGSGKTAAAAQVLAAQARGRRDPEVRAWAAANGFDIRHIPPDPTMCLMVAPTHSMSAVVNRPAVRRYLPPGTEYKYWDAPVEALAILPNGCKIRWLASNQGGLQFEGMLGQFAWVDELCPWEVMSRVMERVNRASYPGRSSGWTLFTATPTTAMSKPEHAWVHTRFEVEKPEGWSKATINGRDNPYYNRSSLERMLAGLSAEERGMTETGAFYVPGGLVYHKFDPRINVIKPIRIHPSWMRKGAMDIGTSAPTAYLASAYDPDNDVLHIYGCHYARELSEAEHYDRIRQVHADLGEPTIPHTLIDANTPGAAHEAATVVRYQEAGMALEPAIKDFAAGVAAMNERLAVGSRNRGRNRSAGDGPGLVIHDTPSLQPLIREISQLAWDQRKTARDGYGSKATRGADHACDPLRYLCLWLWYLLSRG